MKTSTKTTTDICKNWLNYLLLLSHNVTYFDPTLTNPIIQANTCAEVTAFTPTTTHPPTSKPHWATNTITSISHTSIYLASATFLQFSTVCLHVCVSVCFFFSFTGLPFVVVLFWKMHWRKRSNSRYHCSWQLLCVHMRDNRHRINVFHFSVFIELTLTTLLFTLKMKRQAKTKSYSVLCMCHILQRFLSPNRMCRISFQHIKCQRKKNILFSALFYSLDENTFPI